MLKQPKKPQIYMNNSILLYLLQNIIEPKEIFIYLKVKRSAESIQRR